MSNIKLDNSRRWVLGVCSGLSRSFKINKYLLRLSFFVLSFILGGFPILLYFFLYLSMFSVDSEKPKLLGVLSYIAHKKKYDVFYCRFIFSILNLISGILPLTLLYVIGGVILRFKHLKKIN